MSIDAKVDGSVGQKVLFFDSISDDVVVLNGHNIWGGANFLLGDREFARRVWYTKIVFTVPSFQDWNLP